MDLGGHSPPPGRSSDKSPPPRPSHDKRQSSTSAVRSTGPRQTSARPILSKAARNLPSTIEIAVAEASRVKKATQKTAEKVRRDRLKGAVEELIKSTSEPCCSDSAVEPGAETSSSAATKIQGKRHSRFDRKYYFPVPDMEQRIAYCRLW
ncbi:hypothetical protein N658DRAFT_511536 [Parathielavia hyrcaniae]|uniref:Uncharacterized protein n=1 Tax=Parathielavia hyrcaniae TaxID=113614 RepID=A0AAN6PQW0_9PEZI|nr:hypothetical protein N658DRAFT_511536 [Parathielavia hyrcaniae]